MVDMDSNRLDLSLFLLVVARQGLLRYGSVDPHDQKISSCSPSWLRAQLALIN